MKSIHAFFMLILFSCTVMAESMEADRNAALQYWVAFSLLPKQDPEWLIAMRGAPAGPEAEQRKSPALRYLHLGATQTGGRFDSIIGCEAMGAGALLPHINSARMLTRLALARATWRFEHGQHEEGIDDCLATLALAADLSDGACLIELLVSSGLRSAGLTTIARHLPDFAPTQCASLLVRLRDPRLRLRYRDFPRSEATMWRYYLARPAELAQFVEQPAHKPATLLSRDLVALVKANDPRVDVWCREAEMQLAEIVNMIDLPREQFLAAYARHLEAVETNPVFQLTATSTSLKSCLALRAQIVRSELLLAAISCLGRSDGLSSLDGLQTREGRATIAKRGTATVIQVVRHGSEEPIELAVGRVPVGEGDQPAREANDF